MATVSERYPSASGEPRAREGLLQWITTVDHKRIGILYLVTSAAFFLIGGLEALLMRTQLAVPEARLLTPAAYNTLFTMHGTTMIFLVVTPVLLGFANYFVPLMIGARDMVFPRLNALSYWLFLFGGILLNASFLVGQPPSFGWFAYPPLTLAPYGTTSSSGYWALGLIITSVGTIATAVNLLVTSAKLRTPDMTPSRVPIFVWMSAITSFLILGAFPSLTAAQSMLLIEQHLGAEFFRDDRGIVLWQHLFWFFGHPEVYIMVLPAFGILSEVIAVNSRKPIFGYWFIVGSGIAIAFYSFGVWAHHMFAVGLGFVPVAVFGAVSLIIAVPTGIKIFSWLATMWGGRLRLNTAMLFAIGFIAMFTIGGISGVHFAIVPVDWQTTDTYYVVAHMHYVLFGGTYFGILAAAYYWFPKITGRMLSERLGKWHFWLNLIGFNLTFFPMHIIGLMGMPRRVYTYPDLPWWGVWNFIETIGTYLLGISVLLFIINVYISLRRGKLAGPNPWNAWTLEWATTSPPPEYNFSSVPKVRSHRPLWDLENAPDNDAQQETNQPAARRASGPRAFLQNVSSATLGVIVFIGSEVFFFGALIFSYVYFKTSDPSYSLADDLDLVTTTLFSLALWASSGTIYLSERRIKNHDLRGFRVWLLVTIALGAVFLAGQIFEYVTLYDEGITIDLNRITGSFYTLTGFHGVHVAIGLIALSVLARMAFTTSRSELNHTTVQPFAYYWHFVDVVWVALFTIIYLWR